MGTSNAAHNLIIPHPDWARNIPEIAPEDERADFRNWTELARWVTSMLKKGWPGSGGIRSSALPSGGGNLGPVAIGANAATGAVVTVAGMWDEPNERQIVLVSCKFALQPVTVPLGILNCAITVLTYTSAGVLIGTIETIPFILGASAAGDSYPVMCTVPVTVSGTVDQVGFGLVVAGGSAQACTLGYAASVIY